MGDSYGNEEKLSDLLERLQLTERMTVDIADVEKINGKAVDYRAVEAFLKNNRNDTLNYLQNEIGMS